MDAATLLRAYHRKLDGAKTPWELAAFSVDFLDRHKVPVLPTPPAGIKAIRSAHRARVRGEGSPALCDAALQLALKEVPHA